MKHRFFLSFKLNSVPTITGRNRYLSASFHAMEIYGEISDDLIQYSRYESQSSADMKSSKL